MKYRLHITTEGERWDTLAWHYYGNAYWYPKIIAANPHLSLTAVLPVGVTVNIPLLERPKSDSKGLPPWMK